MRSRGPGTPSRRCQSPSRLLGGPGYARPCTGERGLSGDGDQVHAPPGPAFQGGGCRVLPLALQQACLLHAVECLVQGTVGGEESRPLTFLDFLRDQETVEVPRSAEAELDPRFENGELNGE